MKIFSKLFFFNYLLSINCLLFEAHAVRTNGINSDEEYVEIGKRKEFEAVGYVVTYNKESVIFATGTLVNKNTVLTAAHCFKELVEEAIAKKLLIEERTSDGVDILEPVTFSLSDTYVSFKQHITFHTEQECSENPSYYRVKSVTLNPYFIHDKITHGAYVAANDSALLVLEKDPTGITPLPLLQFTVYT